MARIVAPALILFALAAQSRAVAATFVINPTFDSSITSLASSAAIQAAIKSVIATYQTDITNPVTVNITFKNVTTGLGASAYTNYVVSYTNYYNALKASKTSSFDTTALAHLPVGPASPVAGASNVLIKSAVARVLGLSASLNIAGTASDGTVSVNTSVMNLTRTGTQNAKYYDLQSVLMHEINEVLGLGSTMGQGLATPYSTYPSPEDLFRYDATGKHSFTTTSTAIAYFSIDGTTHLDQFNNTGSGDYGDWALSATVQVQDVSGTVGKQPNLNVELTALDVIGYTLNTTLQKTN